MQAFDQFAGQLLNNRHYASDDIRRKQDDVGGFLLSKSSKNG